MASEDPEKSLYTVLPAEVARDLGGVVRDSDGGGSGEVRPQRQLEGFCAHYMRKGDSYEENIHRRRTVLVDNREKPRPQQRRQRQYNRQRRSRHKLTSREKRRLGLFTLPRRQTFASFAPLNALWREYMREVIDVTKVTEANKASSTQHKLLKADYHGAMVTVSRATNPSLVGLTGVVVMETKNVFRLVTMDDRLKTVPKETSVFTIEHDGVVFSIKGAQFRYTAAERIHRKFKFTPRVSTDL